MRNIEDVITQLNTMKDRAYIAEKAVYLLVDHIDDFVQKHEKDSIDNETLCRMKEIIKIVKKTE